MKRPISAGIELVIQIAAEKVGTAVEALTLWKLRCVYVIRGMPSKEALYVIQPSLIDCQAGEY
jgi:hypothetical protein